MEDATRLLTSILAPAEKRTLVWLAHRMPRRINSDHLTALALAVDAVGTSVLLGGLGLSGYMSPVVALLLLVAYLLLLVETFLAAYALRTFKMSYFKVWPTELRVLLAAGTLVLLVHPRAGVFGHQYLLFNVAGVVAILGLLFTLVVAAATNTRALYAAEPLPARAPRP